MSPNRRSTSACGSQLEDFDQAQVADLNQPLSFAARSSRSVPALAEFLGGHPYLTRKALYTLMTEKLTWEHLGRLPRLRTAHSATTCATSFGFCATSRSCATR